MMRAKPTETRTTPANVSQPGRRRPSRACVDIVASLFGDGTQPSHEDGIDVLDDQHRPVGMTFGRARVRARPDLRAPSFAAPLASPTRRANWAADVVNACGRRAGTCGARLCVLRTSHSSNLSYYPSSSGRNRYRLQVVVLGLLG